MQQTWLGRVCVAVLFLTTATAAFANEYPSKAIHLILPQPPGGGIDSVSRLLAARLSEQVGQPVVIENVPGGNGSLAAARVAQAEPDGYTLFMAVDTNLVVNPVLYKNLTYDPFRDFAPVGVVAKILNVLVVRSSLGVNTVQEFVALAKAKPGQLNYASAGNGTVLHLTMEMMKHNANIDITHIPYKGMAPAITDLIADRVDAIYSGIAFVKAHPDKLKAIAVASRKRSPLAPDIPTLEESGVPGIDITTWNGMLAPAATPKPIIDRLSAEIKKAVADPRFRDGVQALGFEPFASTPNEMLTMMKTDTAKWAEIIRTTGIKID